MASRRAQFNIPLLRDQIEGRLDRLMDGLEEEMELVVREGADDMQRIIDTAVTPTGEARVAAGGQHAGRRETDAMYQAVKSEVEREGDRTIVGRFGWIDEYKDYFGIQNDGFGNLAGMDAIGQSYAKAEDRLRGVIEKVR